jgi:hypothetical protein
VGFAIASFEVPRMDKASGKLRGASGVAVQDLNHGRWAAQSLGL